MSEIGEVPVARLGKEAVLQGLKSEVLSHLWQEHGPRDDDDAECHHVRKNARRDAESLSGMLKAKTQQCLWILSNRIPISRAGQTLLDARDLIASLAPDTAGPQPDIGEVLVSRQNLARHLLLLDGAVDRLVSDLLFRHREDGSWAGVVAATDESPPKQARFRGLMFQNSVLFWGAF